MKRSHILVGLFAAFALAFGVMTAAPSIAQAQTSDTPLTVGTDASLQAQATQYPLWVGGIRVTSANKNDVLGDGGHVKFNPKTNTLTLKNAKITTAHVYSSKLGANTTWWNMGIHHNSNKTLKIKLVGTNRIWMPTKNSPVQNNGIYSIGSLIIGGTGSLFSGANSAQVFSVGIVTDKNLTIQGKAKVEANGVATKIEVSFIKNQSWYGGYGVVARKVTLKGKASLTAIGTKLAFYKVYNPSFSFAKGYTPQVKAGSSAKSISVNKKSPAKSVYTKYKYVKITKAKAASKKPAKMTIVSIKPNACGFDAKWKLLTQNCTHYQVELTRISTGQSWKYETESVQGDEATNGFNPSGLVSGDQYSLRVRGLNKVGSKTYYGAWSDKKYVTPL